MKYDDEYNSYKFSSDEVGIITHALIYYSNDPFLDKITQKSVINLLDGLNKSIRIPIDQQTSFLG